MIIINALGHNCELFRGLWEAQKIILVICEKQKLTNACDKRVRINLKIDLHAAERLYTNKYIFLM